MSLAKRHLKPELLDELPASAPEAVHSRADLRRINALMGNAHWLARTARELELAAPQSLLELACGDGVLLLKLLRVTGWRPRKIILLDQQPVISEATLASLKECAAEVEVVTADVFTYLSAASMPRVELVTTNLFLHHFTDERLRELLALIATKADAFIACEPRRAAFARFNARLLGLIGCNHVTRHDAVVSVEAGFTGGELGQLWHDSAAWRIHEGSAGFFSHRFGARRKEAHL